MGIELTKCHETLLYCCCATEMRAVRRRKAVHVHYNSRLLQIIGAISDPGCHCIKKNNMVEQNDHFG